MAFTLSCPARAQSEFVPSHKKFAEYVKAGFEIKGTWGGHVIILQKGNEVAFCDIILKNDLFATLREGCAELDQKSAK